jgi:hypothetical protein
VPVQVVLVAEKDAVEDVEVVGAAAHVQWRTIEHLHDEPAVLATLLLPEADRLPGIGHDPPQGDVVREVVQLHATIVPTPPIDCNQGTAGARGARRRPPYTSGAGVSIATRPTRRSTTFSTVRIRFA